MTSKVDYEYTLRQNAPTIAARIWATGSSISVSPESIATMQDESNRYSMAYWVAVYNSLTDAQRNNMVFVFSRTMSSADFRAFMAEGAKNDARNIVANEFTAREHVLTEREQRAARALDAMDRAIQAQSNAIRVSNDAYASNTRLLARVEQLEAENRALEERYERMRDKLARLLDEA